MREIAPGIVHWQTYHGRIHVEGQLVHGRRGRRACSIPGRPTRASTRSSSGSASRRHLTNRHHYRQSGQLASRLRATVYCDEAGMHGSTHGEQVVPSSC